MYIQSSLYCKLTFSLIASYLVQVCIKPTCTTALKAHRWTTRAAHSNFIDGDDPELVVGEW